MSEQARKRKTSNESKVDIEGYKPKSVPKVLKVIEGKLEQGMMEKEEIGMIQQIKMIEGFKAVGIKCVGLQNFSTLIPEAVKKIYHLYDMMPYKVNNHLHYGLSPCVPGQDNPSQHIYYVALEVKEFDGVPEGLECLTVPSQKCMVIRKERKHDVKRIYTEMHDYINNMNLQKAVTETPKFYNLEIYNESLPEYYRRFIKNQGDSYEMDVCVPIL